MCARTCTRPEPDCATALLNTVTSKTHELVFGSPCGCISKPMTIGAAFNGNRNKARVPVRGNKREERGYTRDDFTR